MDTRQDSGTSPVTQSLNMLSPRGLYRQLFFKRKILVLAWGGWLGWVTVSYPIDINPSKPQGGSTNNIPHKTEAGAHSLFPNALKWIFGSPHSAAMERIHAPPHFKVELSTEPKNFPVTTNAVLKAHMTITNQGDKYILEFNTAQHYDFVINNKDGKEFYRYSNDKVFSQELSSIVLNRNEKLTYEEVTFSPTNQIPNLPPGEYNLIGQVTAKIPISVETSFRVVP